MKKYEIIKIGGIATIVGSLCAVIADIVGILVYKNHNPIKQTISQLAHGKYAYIQDLGLTFFGLGTLVASIALYVWKLKSVKWILGVILLAFMGISTIVLAEFNQFAGEPGTTIHIVIALLIGVSFLLSTLLLGFGFKKMDLHWYYLSVGIGITFLVACSGFLIISENYEGIYERGVATIMLVWFLALGYNLIKYQEKLVQQDA